MKKSIEQILSDNGIQIIKGYNDEVLTAMRELEDQCMNDNRMMIAAMTMQGMYSNHSVTDRLSDELIRTHSIRQTDLLIKELEK